jgi:hypothetical protein
MLRKASGREREKVTRDGRKQLKEDPHELYSSPNDIRIIISRKM